MMSFFALVLAHLVKQRDNAKNAKSEQTDNAKCYSPTFAIVKAFDEHHKTNDGKDNGCSKVRKLHSDLIFLM